MIVCIDFSAWKDFFRSSNSRVWIRDVPNCQRLAKITERDGSPAFRGILSRFLRSPKLGLESMGCEWRISNIGLCNIRNFPKFELQYAPNFPILVTKVSGNFQTGALPS